jgi:predicted FMN-binding regulatory protein PaiB
LRAIVGIEVTVERVEEQAKFSQNCSDEDRGGVVRGLQEERSQRATCVAVQMATSTSGGPPGSTG